MVSQGCITISNYMLVEIDCGLQVGNPSLEQSPLLLRAHWVTSLQMKRFSHSVRLVAQPTHVQHILFLASAPTKRILFSMLSSSPLPR